MAIATKLLATRTRPSGRTHTQWRAPDGRTVNVVHEYGATDPESLAAIAEQVTNLRTKGPTDVHHV